jgi:beta-xylosidase
VARRVLLLAATALALLAGLLVPATAPASSLAREPFVVGQPYRGAFADPTVVRVGGTYVAHATTTANLSLPTLVSRDLRTWTARPDALVQPGAWVAQRSRPDGTTFSPTWAPSVAAIPGHGWAAAYSAPWSRTGQRCLQIAHGDNPLGPFTDTTTWPLTCGFAGTAIDPQLFRDGGRTYLMMKSKGVPNRLAIRQLDAAAVGFAPGSVWRTVLAPRDAWEGGVVENPAMVRFNRRLYLFWSGNAFDTAGYATGYAVCRTVVGPCRRKGRLLATNSVLAGPGGATPFFDTAGRLRLAYHAYTTAEVPSLASSECATQVSACPPRRLYVATLAPARKGRLKVVAPW